MATTKGRRFHPQALTTAEVEALMAACSPTSATGKRNRALIVVLWRGALRCDEALSLRLHDLDRAAGSIRVMFGKGRRARTVAVEPRAWAVIEQWLAARKDKDIPRSAPLFCTISGPGRGRKLSDRYVRALMTDLGEKAEIGKRVHPHALRHSRAVEMRREGKDILLISRALGHSNVSTTERYIGHLYPREVLEAMLDSEWDRASDNARQ